MPERRGVTGRIAEKQCAIVGANIRTLRLRNGWSQIKLGELMGWQSASTVCAAEGHRNDRQRGFTTVWGSRTRPSVLTWASMRLARTR
jgi:hypothetical protein